MTQWRSSSIAFNQLNASVAPINQFTGFCVRVTLTFNGLKFSWRLIYYQAVHYLKGELHSNS